MFWAFLLADVLNPDDNENTPHTQRLIEKKIEDNLVSQTKSKSLAQHHEDVSIENMWQKLEGFFSLIIKKGVQVAYKLYPKTKTVIHTSDPKSAVIKITHGGYTQKDVNCPPAQQVLNEDDTKENKKVRLVALNKDCGVTDVFCNTKSLPIEPPQQL